MSDEKKKIEQDIFDAEFKLARARAAQAAFDQLTAAQRLAIELHDFLCHSEHAETCGWFYEINNDIHDWSRWTHSEALKRANSVLLKFSEATVVGVLKALKESR